jgi:hypothetical protein
VNLDAHQEFFEQLVFFWRITNLFDKEYKTAAVRRENFSTATAESSMSAT